MADNNLSTSAEFADVHTYTHPSSNTNSTEGSFWWWSRCLVVVFILWVFVRVALTAFWRYMGWDSKFEMYV